jgi:predicted PurR-regulated permease PerM
MYRLHNQKGAALVLVLWIIVLLSILGTILFSQLLTTTHQMNKQEEATLESDLTNMAAIYVSTYINQTDATQDTISGIIDGLPDQIVIDQHSVGLEARINDTNENEILLEISIEDVEGEKIKIIPLSH